MYIQVCTSYVPAVFLGRTSSIPGRIKLYVRYIYMYIPGAHQLAQKNHLGSCSFAWNTSTMLPLGRRQTVEPQDKWHTWDVLETSCIKMTWPEKESKDKNANWHSIDSCWLMLTCKSSFMQRPFYKEPEDHVQLKRSVESPPKSSESMWKHQESAASAAIGVQWDWRQFLVSLEALKTNEAAMELNCAELCWTVHLSNPPNFKYI